MIDFDFNPSIKALNKQLEKLEAALQDKGQKAGMRAAAAPLKKAMKVHAPSRTGRVKKSITHQLISGRKRKNLEVMVGKGQVDKVTLTDAQYALMVGPNRKVAGINPSYYAHITEFGAKAHTITVRKKNQGKTLRMSRTSSTQSNFFFAKGAVSHPGLSGMGWMAKSHDSAASQINSGFYSGLKKYLDKHA